MAFMPGLGWGVRYCDLGVIWILPDFKHAGFGSSCFLFIYTPKSNFYLSFSPWGIWFSPAPIWRHPTLLLSPRWLSFLHFTGVFKEILVVGLCDRGAQEDPVSTLCRQESRGYVSVCTRRRKNGERVELCCQAGVQWPENKKFRCSRTRQDGYLS